jgi:hypothetical protein
MTNLHPNAPHEADERNAFHSGHDTLLGRPTQQLLHRLDAMILVQKTCKMNVCREPWAQFHPDGDVKNLIDALDSKYDELYARVHEAGTVGWEHCYGDDQATLYNLDNERPLWKDVKKKVMQNETIQLKRNGAENWEEWTHSDEL